MKERDIHPCFSCTLPDCDENSPFCRLRVVHRDYHRLSRQGQKIGEVLKAQRSIAYRELYLPTRREKLQQLPAARLAGGRS